MTELILYDLPKISLNKFYSSPHWTLRSRIKNEFKLAVESQTMIKFSSSKSYEVEYHFEFRVRPLDVSNCVGGMVKLLEDVIFEKDDWKVIRKMTVTSKKGVRDLVRIKVVELDSGKSLFE